MAICLYIMIIILDIFTLYLWANIWMWYRISKIKYVCHKFFFYGYIIVHSSHSVNSVIGILNILLYNTGIRYFIIAIKNNNK